MQCDGDDDNVNNNNDSSDAETGCCSTGSKWWICGVCEDMMTKKTPAIACVGGCRNWIHLSCANLNYKEAKRMKKTFMCNSCRPVPEPVPEDNRKWMCGFCDEIMSKNTPSIACTGGCRNWIHLKCANLNYKQAKKVEKTFICNNCAPMELDDSQSDPVSDSDMDITGTDTAGVIIDIINILKNLINQFSI